MPRSLAILSLVVGLCACHSPQAPQPHDSPQPQSGSSAVMNSPLGTLVKDRNRAAAVQKIVDDQAAKQSKDIDDQSH